MRKELTAKQKRTLRQQEYFGKSESLKEAFHMVSGGADAHERFIHYTTLSRVFQNFTTKRWWFTRSDFDRMNDTQEAKKFGCPELLSRTYQISLSYGSAENAAMWGLYCPGDPFGVKVSMRGTAMREWFAALRKKKFAARLEYASACAKHGQHVGIGRQNIESANARDLIYVATNFSDQSKKHRAGRQNSLCWFMAHTNAIENLSQEINEPQYTGWLKDYEWRQENETRMAIRVKGVSGKLPEHLSIDIPEDVLKSMRFTLSPWLKEEYHDEVIAGIKAMASTIHGDALPKNLVVQSAITGALESWRDRYKGNLKRIKGAKE